MKPYSNSGAVRRRSEDGSLAVYYSLICLHLERHVPINFARIKLRSFVRKRGGAVSLLTAVETSFDARIPKTALFAFALDLLSRRLLNIESGAVGEFMTEMYGGLHIRSNFEML